MLYVSLRESRIESDDKHLIWMQYSSHKRKNKDDYLVLLNESLYTTFETYLKQIAIKKYYNHYLVKVKDVMMLKVFMVACFMRKPIGYYKQYFGIETDADKKKRQLLARRKPIYIIVNRKPKRVYASAGGWWYIDKEKLVEIPDDQIVSSTFK